MIGDLKKISFHFWDQTTLFFGINIERWSLTVNIEIN